MTNRQIIQLKSHHVQVALKACMTKKMLEAPRPETEDDAYFEMHAKAALEWWEGVLAGMKMLMRSEGVALDVELAEDNIARNLITGLRTQSVWKKILDDLEAF